MPGKPQDWIDRLQLQQHPEGGWYSEIYRAPQIIPQSALHPDYGTMRNAGTCIYFLLKSGEISHLHRLRSDELWHYQLGSSLTLSMIQPDGKATTQELGPEATESCSLHALIKAGTWFGAEVNAPDSFTLMSCTVIPGFEFADFQMGERASLLEAFPQHRALIERLTHE